MLAQRLSDHDDTPHDDHIVVVRGARWQDYRRQIELRGDRSVPRIAFLEGALQLMSPSREHEALKSWIGRLVEVWCLERGVEFGTYGSWTIENERELRAVEPDECYVFGGTRDPQRPDLAIEVIWTSGGIDKREIYRRLGVRELWFWRRGRITVFVLRGDQYVEVPGSEVLPGIDLGELVGFLERPTTSQAIRDYRAALRARG